jgi:hypothetical protein
MGNSESSSQTRVPRELLPVLEGYSGGVKHLIKQITHTEFIHSAEIILFGSPYEKAEYFTKLPISPIDLFKVVLKETFKLHFDSIYNELLSEDKPFLDLFTASNIFIYCFQICFEYHLLKKSPLKLTNNPSTLIDLNLSLIFYIEFHKQPKLLYTSQAGKSWTILQEKLAFAEQSIIIIKDTKGNIFGGFNPQPYINSPTFTSNSDSWIFEANPGSKPIIYKPTQINNNHVYFCHGKSTLPNGLGFGGQIDYFGFFIDQNLDYGHSRCEPLSSTFQNPRLSAQADFGVDRIEVYVVKDRDLDSVEYKKSITQNAELRALMELSGQKFYSVPEPVPKDKE